MQHIRLKAVPVLTAVSLLLLHQGCSHIGTAYQTRDQDTQEQSEVIEDSAPTRPEFILGPGDRLEIKVYRNDDLTREVWIDHSGKLMYPLTGDIHAASLSIFQLRDRIRDGLSKYIIDPQVTVRILSIQSQKIIVLGEVDRPGYFPADVPISTIEAISAAGGFTVDAKQKTILLIRGGMNNPELKVLDIEKALKRGVLTDNIVLHGGDILYVPNTSISDVSRFFAHLSTIISPIVSGESAYLLGRQIESGEEARTSIPLR